MYHPWILFIFFINNNKLQRFIVVRHAYIIYSPWHTVFMNGLCDFFMPLKKRKIILEIYATHLFSSVYNT